MQENTHAPCAPPNMRPISLVAAEHFTSRRRATPILKPGTILRFFAASQL